MESAEIEKQVKELVKTIGKEEFDKQDFIYKLLAAYGLPKSSITRLKKGNLQVEGEIDWKKKLFFKEDHTQDLHSAISEKVKELKHQERFVIYTDYKIFLAIDTHTKESLDIPLKNLAKHYDFFLPWAGLEKAQHHNENPADIKAAEKMARLFDEIKKDNPDNSPEFIHGLNVFLSRLLFCFFAEDTSIFQENQFTNAVGSHTQQDGSDLNSYLDKLFTVLNTPENKRRGLPEYLKAFPYVNGGLFEKEYKTPKFSRSSRTAILNSGDLDWSAINPDIFGSMFQAVIGAEQRGSLGQHYTSVPNIMKVIEPLFLNELYEEFKKAKNNEKKLNVLLNRIYKLKIFDPACGSGNFLIIAYKELRLLEMKIFKAGDMMALSRIQLAQFYGIEIDDFAAEIAKLALWLAEHQMNVEFLKEFGKTNPTLPLKEAGHIVQGNATRLDWEEVCPKYQSDTELAEVYILGNPPYLGSSMQNKKQKEELSFVFNNYKIKKYKSLDYISIWFIKAAHYLIQSNVKCAFVTTNSICQGQQVKLLWSYIQKSNIEIFFVHSSFKWKNNAKGNAGVTVVIIGIEKISSNNKKIYSNQKYLATHRISPYLIPNVKTIVRSRNTQLSLLPDMIKGCSPGDGGNLLLSQVEKTALITNFPLAEKFLKKYVGAKEFMYNNFRYCIWVDEKIKEEAYAIPEFSTRFEKVKEFRLASKKQATQKKALFPYFFDERKYKESNSIIVPQTGSERRKYMPIGFFNSEYVISNAVRVIYDAQPWYFGLLSSKMHIIWVKAVAGRLKWICNIQIRYATTLSPFHQFQNSEKKK